MMRAAAAAAATTTAAAHVICLCLVSTYTFDTDSTPLLHQRAIDLVENLQNCVVIRD